MPDASLPSGTVTFLFTDIEESTRAWERDAGGMREALARHDALLRQAIEARGGHVFKTMGDAFCAAFPSAPAALEAALAAQRGLCEEFGGEAGPARVRMAVHTGEAESRDGDYFGKSLNRVARLLSVGHGAQVLISASTRELVQGSLPDGATLRDLGEHRLKDLERPERVFQLDHADLPVGYPPLRSLDHLPHNLPVQLTSFIGREPEIGDVERLLGAHRLVTLTGAGGSGKTRLALQVAVGLLEDYPDGVWFIDLAALSDPALLPQTAASAFGVRERLGQDISETLDDHLRSKTLLVVLDNCEHLVEACAEWVESTLRAAPQVRVLATSREGLGCGGEVVWTVPPLSVPESTDLDPAVLLRAIDRSEAVQLFADRARLVQPGFEITAEDAASIARICRRLDGIPLAIELAAARVRVLAPDQIAARLDDRFRLLAGGRRALPRHQTLQAAIDWSHDLLEEAERVLFRRCAVFSGGWTLEAAEAVCADPEPEGTGGAALDPIEVLDHLARLVEKSLVLADRVRGGGVRYRMLESTRQYALERLFEASEGEAIRARHGAWCLALLEDVRAISASGEDPRYDATVGPEIENMRAALDWCLTGEQRWTGFRIAVDIAIYWRRSGLLREGLEWVERALAATRDSPARERARGFAALSTLSYFRGDYQRARQASDRALELAGDAEEDDVRLSALVSAIRVGFHSDDEAVWEGAMRMTEQAVALARRLGHVHAEMVLTVNLGERLRGLGDLEEARKKYEEALRLVKGELGHAILFNLGQTAVEQEEADRGEDWYRRAYAVSSRSGDRLGWGYVVLGMGQVAALRSEGVRAARLLGAASAILESFGETLNSLDGRVFDRSVAACRAALGDDFETAWNAGRAMPHEQALAEAFGAAMTATKGSPKDR